MGGFFKLTEKQNIFVEVLKRTSLPVVLLLIAVMVQLTACGGPSKTTSRDPVDSEKAEEDANLITIGFSQLGAESDWRSANTDSMRSVFNSERGYKLEFKDGQQKQSNQITAIRSFIQQGVDYIVLAPVTTKGWDSVLGEARDAEIPVIIVDRMVDVEDEELYTCWVGSDFLEEGEKACEWLNAYALSKEIAPEDIHIVDIQGTLDSSAQLGRTKGLENAVKKYGWDLLEETPGDFNQAKGREVMAQMLRTYDNINVVYCENDNEALGAVEAIQASGKKAGGDIANGEIMVISFDGINTTAMEYCIDGTISLIVECNPLHGPRVEEIVRSLEEGKTPEKKKYVYETLYSSLTDVSFVSVRGTDYQVTYLSQKVLDGR